MKPARLAAILLVAAACNSKSASVDRAPSATAAIDQPVSGSAATKGDVTTKSTPQAGAGSAAGPLAHEDHRKVIRTGRIELLVATYDDARAKIDALVAAAGGYVDSTSVNRRQDSVSDGVIVVRLPQTAFGDVIPKLKDIGEVLSETTNAADITEEYVDISARLASAQVLEKRLLELASARDGKIEQVLEVERELARVRGEVEGYQGHLRQWNDQIAMSTLTLSIATKRPEIVAAPTVAPSLGNRTSHAFSASISALRDAGSWLVVNGVAALPWLVLCAPLALIARRLARRFASRLPRAIARPGTTVECGSQDAGGSASAG
jgi:hypothetical protein